MKKDNNIINTKNIVIALLILICFILSFYLYGRNKSKVFKDEYMENIFVEENETNTIKENKVEEVKSNEISLEKVNKIIVEIKGEVNKPDVYEVEDGAIIRDLIEIAGGLTGEANIDSINRAQKLRANELIIIPNKSENIASISVSSEVNISNNSDIININTASIDELQRINGIGEVKAKSIIEYREKNGGFKSIEEIKNIEGIGEKTFEKIKDKIAI